MSLDIDLLAKVSETSQSYQTINFWMKRFGVHENPCEAAYEYKTFNKTISWIENAFAVIAPLIILNFLIIVIFNTCNDVQVFTYLKYSIISLLVLCIFSLILSDRYVRLRRRAKAVRVPVDKYIEWVHYIHSKLPSYTTEQIAKTKISILSDRAQKHLDVLANNAITLKREYHHRPISHFQVKAARVAYLQSIRAFRYAGLIGETEYRDYMSRTKGMRFKKH